MFGGDPTGAIYQSGSQYVYFYPEYTIFWLTDTKVESGQTYTTHFIKMFNQELWSTAPYQHGPNGYAPLVFVQDVDPIEKVQ